MPRSLMIRVAAVLGAIVAALAIGGTALAASTHAAGPADTSSPTPTVTVTVTPAATVTPTPTVTVSPSSTPAVTSPAAPTAPPSASPFSGCRLATTAESTYSVVLHRTVVIHVPSIICVSLRNHVSVYILS